MPSIQPFFSAVLSWPLQGAGPGTVTSFFSCVALWACLPQRWGPNNISRIISTFHAIISVHLAVMCIIQPGFNTNSTQFMTFSTQPILRGTIGITTGYLIFDLGYMLAVPTIRDISAITHHLVIGTGFLSGLYAGFVTPYHILFLLNEASTPFVNIHWWICDRMKHVKASVRPQVSSATATATTDIQTLTALRTYNGVAMWLSFLVARVIVNSFIVYTIVQHVSGDPVIWAVAPTLLPFQLLLCTSAQVLNLMWFWQITQGIIRAVKGLWSPSKPGFPCDQTHTVSGEAAAAAAQQVRSAVQQALHATASAPRSCAPAPAMT